MKKIITFFGLLFISLVAGRLYAETDTITCAIFMYPKATVGCHTYAYYTGNAPDNATYIWNFAGGTVISGSGKGPYVIQWDTVGYKTVTLYVSYQSQYCYTYKTTYIGSAPQVFNMTGGGSYPVGGTGVHIGLSGSEINYSYYLYLNGGTTIITTKAGTGTALDFGLFTAPGTYTCKAKLDSSSFVCAVNMNDSAVVTISGYVPKQYICMVTFDTVTQRNMIIWNKITGLNLDHFNIYRQTYQENVFEKIGEVPYNSFSTYTDITANPVTMAYKYELSVSDITGSESEKSSYHKTIHLEVSPGINGFNLIWNPYEGFTFLTYKIHRKLETSPWETIDSIASDLISYTDPYVTSGLVTYYIEVVRYAPCNPTIKSGFYETIISNPMTTAPLGVSEIVESRVLIYPNPVREKVHVVCPGAGNSICTIEIYSLDGRKYFEQKILQPRAELDLSALPAGMYFLKIIGREVTGTGKFMKE